VPTTMPGFEDEDLICLDGNGRPINISFGWERRNNGPPGQDGKFVRYRPSLRVENPCSLEVFNLQNIGIELKEALCCSLAISLHVLEVSSKVLKFGYAIDRRVSVQSRPSH